MRSSPNLRLDSTIFKPARPDLIFQASASEKAAIARFLEFALKDLKFQFEDLRRELGSPTTAELAAQLADLQTHAIIIRKYLAALKSGLDAMEQVN